MKRKRDSWDKVEISSTRLSNESEGGASLDEWPGETDAGRIWEVLVSSVNLISYSLIKKECKSRIQGLQDTYLPT